jgi:alkanesulfonate monooxygenase SsuD/methylene tetrahydromethanopterin reductase-like flavin-dependent oxidoreductase (luciferase family)
VPHARKIRFAIQLTHARDGAEWAGLARQAEADGYAVLSLPDHLRDQFAPLPALTAAAAATTVIRLSTFILANDLRHPAVLAKEIATLDVLSGGRVELGVGAGWSAAEFHAMGIPFDPAAVRIDRLREAVTILRALLSGEPATFSGRYYQIDNVTIRPRPAQPAGIPLVLGGGGPKMLALAAEQADIVSLTVDGRSRRTGVGDPPDPITALAYGRVPGASADYAATYQAIRWATVADQIFLIRGVAGRRFGDIELNTRILTAVSTGDREHAALELTGGAEPAAEALLDSPYVLIGTEAQIKDQILRARAELGLSYYIVGLKHAQVLRPIVAALAGR